MTGRRRTFNRRAALLMHMSLPNMRIKEIARAFGVSAARMSQGLIAERKVLIREQFEQRHKTQMEER